MNKNVRNIRSLLYVCQWILDRAATPLSFQGCFRSSSGEVGLDAPLKYSSIGTRFTYMSAHAKSSGRAGFVANHEKLGASHRSTTPAAPAHHREQRPISANYGGPPFVSLMSAPGPQEPRRRHRASVATTSPL